MCLGGTTDHITGVRTTIHRHVHVRICAVCQSTIRIQRSAISTFKTVLLDHTKSFGVVAIMSIVVDMNVAHIVMADGDGDAVAHHLIGLSASGMFLLYR